MKTLSPNKPTEEELQEVVEFMVNNMVEPMAAALTFIELGVRTNDQRLQADTIISMCAVAAKVWEKAEDVELADQLFKFLGGKSGD